MPHNRYEWLTFRFFCASMRSRRRQGLKWITIFFALLPAFGSKRNFNHQITDCSSGAGS
jgi:hypothetical protein